jgi:hypothetical protein
MGLFRRETAQEKAAREAERRREETDRAEREAARRREAEEELAHERAFAATLPKYEYRVVQLSADIVASGGAFDPDRLTGVLNAQAADGWRLRELAMSGKIEQGFAADRNDVYVVFERPARPRAGASAAVD